MSSEYLTANETPGHQQGYSELSSSPDASVNPSRPGSSQDVPVTRRGRVRFNSTSEANDAANKRSSVPTRRDRSLSPVVSVSVSPPMQRTSPAHSRNTSLTSLLRHTPESERDNPFDDTHASPIPRPKPSAFRKNSNEPPVLEETEEGFDEKTFSALAAQERAQRIASLVGSHSAPTSARTSLDEVDEDESPLRPSKIDGLPVRLNDIPLVDMGLGRTYDGTGYDNEDAELQRNKNSEAHDLVRAHTRKYRSGRQQTTSTSGLMSGHVTPTEERSAEDYVPRPQQYRPGILANLLKLYNPPGASGTPSRPQSLVSLDSSPIPLSAESLGSSPGSSTPTAGQQKWYHQRNQSQDTLAGLVEASNILGGVPAAARKKTGPIRPGMGKRTHSGRIIEAASKLGGKPRPRLEDEIRITIHIAETLSRQKYLLKLCKALMWYGAPTHRLEEYMTMSARVLETDGQFLYMPGCMIVSFDDVSTHTTEVKLVKVQQGVDLGKLKDVHEIYKEVVHDVIGVEEATQRLDAIMNAKPKYSPWLLVLVYGFASAAVAPYGKSGGQIYI